MLYTCQWSYIYNHINKYINKKLLRRKQISCTTDGKVLVFTARNTSFLKMHEKALQIYHYTKWKEAVTAKAVHIQSNFSTTISFITALSRNDRSSMAVFLYKISNWTFIVVTVRSTLQSAPIKQVSLHIGMFNPLDNYASAFSQTHIITS